MVDLRPVIVARERTLCCHSAVFSGRFAPNTLAAVGDELGARGGALAIWTLRNAGAQQTLEQLTAVCEAGASTVITAEPATVLGYLEQAGL